MKRSLAVAIVLLTVAGCGLWARARQGAVDELQSRLVRTQQERDRLKESVGELARLPRDRMIAEREQRLLAERLERHPSARAILDGLTLPKGATLLELEVRR